MAGPPDSQNPNALPRRVTPQNVSRPIDPEEVYDMTLGPGDSVVQAAYNRTSRNTTFLSPAAARLGEGEGTDALMLRKVAKRSRSLTFTVQGIMWRAGFAPDMSQTPLGQSSPFRRIGETETNAPNGAILRPVPTLFEMVFKELIPRPLLDQCDQMYGMVRKLEGIAFYYFPAGEGATAGAMARYLEQPASRAHVLYLQTNIKNASPTVLDQIQKTFEMAVPRAQEAAKEATPGDFWHEIDRAAYQVTATFKNSVLGAGTRAATNQLQRGAKQAGTAVDKSASVIDAVNRGFDAAAAVPAKVGVGVVRGFTRAIVGAIEGLDKLLRQKE